MMRGIRGLTPEPIRLLVQGITGREGSFHTKRMREYGTDIVAGVTPGKGGRYIHDIPVYDTVSEAVEETDANTSIVFVPAKYAYDAVLEAILSGIKLIVVITEGIPTHGTLKLVNIAKLYGSKIIGPNTPGFIIPGYTKVGIMPEKYFSWGDIAVISRSGTLTYEISHAMLKQGFGQRIVIGCGGDYIIGTNFTEIFELLKEDPHTKAAVVIGEVGGNDEELLAEYIIREKFKKPVVAYIAGKTAPPGKRMGHAGAIIMGGMGTVDSKINKFREANIPVVETPSDIPKILEKLNL